MNGYWVCYELDNDTLATWSDYACSPDEFIDNLLKKEFNIKKFTELLIDEQAGVSIIPPRKISISKYNRKIKA